VEYDKWGPLDIYYNDGAANAVLTLGETPLCSKGTTRDTESFHLPHPNSTVSYSHCCSYR
jgi:hypothetical protein